MDSFSKIPLSAELAQSIVSAHFGTSRRLVAFEELHEGYFNAAARLELDDGLKCVLKAAPADEVRILRYEKNIMRAEVESMRLVAKRTTLPVAHILAYDTTRRLFPSDFFLMEFLPGTSFYQLRPQLDVMTQQQVERQLGQIAHEINQICGESFGYWASPCASGTSWRACFVRMVQNVLQDGLDMQVDLERPYEEIMGLIERHLPALDAVTTPRLVHWDLWDGNIFVDPATLKVTGVIDFERVLWADPLMEAFFGNPDPHSAYVAGYGGPLFEDFEQVRRRVLYNAYLFLIMVIEAYFRKYETNDLTKWARARLRETLKFLETH
jgi:aminoglycoside phosphotransferase (APT) family kinase protein